MNRAITNELGSAYWGMRIKPRDPIWASRSSLDRVRRELRNYDSHLNLWWAGSRHARVDVERPGRWRVVRYTPGQGGWLTIFFWEGLNGEYREPWPVEPILSQVRLCDVGLKIVMARTDEKNERLDRKKREETLRMVWEGVKDAADRYMGRKIVTGPGYIRPRRFYQLERSKVVAPKLIFPVTK